MLIQMGVNVPAPKTLQFKQTRDSEKMEDSISMLIPAGRWGMEAKTSRQKRMKESQNVQ